MLMSKEKNIAIITAISVGVGGLIALLTYVTTRKHREFQNKNSELENEIKKLQLEKLKVELKK